MTPSTTPEPAQDLRLQLRTLLEEATGTDLSAAPADAGFLELGLDSLALTQVAIRVRQTFGVAVSFRQLMENLGSLANLATHLAQTMPAPIVPMVPVVPLSTGDRSTAPLSTPHPGPTMSAYTAATAAQAGAVPLAGSAPLLAPPLPTLPAMVATNPMLPMPALHGLMQMQLQLMAQQLTLLQAGAGEAKNNALIAPAPATLLGTPLVAVAPPVPATPAPAATGPASPPVPAPAAATDTATYDVKKAFGAIARIYTDPGAALSVRQRARLAAFMRAYTERTAASKRHTQTHRPHLADPRVVNGFRPLLKEIVYQIVVERSQGACLWDLDGNEYVDVINGFGMSLFGWQPPFVLEAVRRQLDSGYEIGPLHPLAGEVARLICELGGHDRAALCNTGSEAVMGALRIARTVTGRNLIVTFAGSYHGTFDEVIVRQSRHLRPVPAAPGILSNTTEHIIVLDYGTPEALAIIRAKADQIAAILIEPVQSRRPDFQPREFLHAVRDLSTQHGMVFILDEVITGFRTAPGGIQELFGLQADLCTYGKVIGGGFPIGVIAGKRQYMDALDGGAWDYGDASTPTVGVTYFAGTFVRHPLALAAAQATLEHLKAAGPALQQALGTTTQALADALNALCRAAGAPLEIRSFASIWKIFFLEEHPLQDLLFAMLRHRGIHIIDHFPCFLTTAHTPQHIDRIVHAFGAALAEMQESQWLPRHIVRTALLHGDADTDDSPAVDSAEDLSASPQTDCFDPAAPPVPHARLGRDAEGNPAWFVPDAANPGKFARLPA